MLSIFYPVASIRELAAHVRTTRGSLYGPLNVADSNIAPRLLRRLLARNLIERCGEYLYFTDSGLHACVTS